MAPAVKRHAREPADLEFGRRSAGASRQVRLRSRAGLHRFWNASMAGFNFAVVGHLSMYTLASARRLAFPLNDSLTDANPLRTALRVAMVWQSIGALAGDKNRLVLVALQQDVRGTPDI